MSTAPAMLDLARRSYSGIQFDEASADPLPYGDASFDAVVCAVGGGHFSGCRARYGRIRLRSGGARRQRAVLVGGIFARNRINGVFQEATVRLGLSAPNKIAQGPPMDRFCDKDAFTGFLTRAGFGDVNVESISFTCRLGDVGELWALAIVSFTHASSLIRAQRPETRQAVRGAVAEAAEPYRQADGPHIPVAFLVASGMRAE